MKHRIMGLLSAFMLTATVVTPAQAETKYNLTLSGASPEGLWSLLGAGINVALARAISSLHNG